MSKRTPISLDQTRLEILVTMSEGIPGAAVVLAQLAKLELGPILILHLDDMNIRGSQIWVGYKDHCGQDLEKFAQAIQEHDQAMLDTINRECFRPELGEHYTEKAQKAAPV